MLYNQAQALLQRAAGAALERIAGDRASSPWRVRPLLDYLEKNLFDPDLNVDQLKRACGVRDNSIAVAFHAAVGQPPGAYISERRLETAGRLLRETKLPVWQVSDLVGYSSIQVFSRSFGRWAGKSPNAYRRGAADAVTSPLPSETATLPARDVLAPASQPVALLRQFLDRGRTEELKAEELWLAIKNRPQELQRKVARQGLGFQSAAFFECLLKKTRLEGRDNRERGVEIAVLAVESLAALQGHLDPAELVGLEARGWAWLGNAYRLKLDFQNAETALQEAERRLARAPDDLLAHGEVLLNRGALHWYQRRYEEALTVEALALETFRTLERADQMAQALIVQAAVYESAGNLHGAIPVLLEARALLRDQPEPFLNLAISQWLLISFAQTGAAKEAEALLPDVKAIALEVKSARAAAHVTWVEGKVEQLRGNLEEAETRYLEALAGFDRLDDSYHAALVTFDLTMVYALTHRFALLVESASKMLQVFAAVGLPRESLLALNVLSQGIASQDTTQELLREINKGLGQVKRDPRRQLFRP
ncbi:MAG: helix-turn-helix domain-containing protein [Thermoanaerobaculia bacterium]|nr:helix-turn-helix domain-containing protein [Thermoanaerobaculia bacterium]